jgi:hypothetical protein
MGVVVSHNFGCACSDGGYIDDFLKQKKSKTTPRRKLWTPREFNDYLRCTMPDRDQLRKAGVPTKKEVQAMEPSRRNFLKAMMVGAGGVLAWYSGLLRSPRLRATQCVGDPGWDITCWIGSDYFLTCDQWGARPPDWNGPVLNHAPTYFIVHHTATDNSSDLSQAHAISLARGIQNYHMSLGWGDTGQHFTHSRGTWILEGRHDSIYWELTEDEGPRHLQGVHVANYNDVCLGVENEGTYTYVDPPPDMFANLINIATTCCVYNDPMYSYTCYGHRDFNATQCPGDRLYALLPCLRQWVAYYDGEGGGYPNC